MRISDWSSDVCSSDLEGGMTEAVIGRALLRILEAIIGLVDRLELGLVLLAPAMFVRVQIDREAAIGGLDRPRIRIARAAGQFVIIDLGGNRSEEHPSVLQSLMRKPYAVFCLKQTMNHTSSINAELRLHL